MKQIHEGHNKRNGVNPPPSTDKPVMRPPAQAPVFPPVRVCKEGEERLRRNIPLQKIQVDEWCVYGIYMSCGKLSLWKRFHGSRGFLCSEGEWIGFVSGFRLVGKGTAMTQFYCGSKIGQTHLKEIVKAMGTGSRA